MFEFSQKVMLTVSRSVRNEINYINLTNTLSFPSIIKPVSPFMHYKLYFIKLLKSRTWNQNYRSSKHCVHRIKVEMKVPSVT